MGIGGIAPAMKLNVAAKVLRMHPFKNGEITPYSRMRANAVFMKWR
jgi:hypothetical protein